MENLDGLKYCLTNILIQENFNYDLNIEALVVRKAYCRFEGVLRYRE